MSVVNEEPASSFSLVPVKLFFFFPRLLTKSLSGAVKVDVKLGFGEQESKEVISVDIKDLANHLPALLVIGPLAEHASSSLGYWSRSTVWRRYRRRVSYNEKATS